MSLYESNCLFKLGDLVRCISENKDNHYYNELGIIIEKVVFPVFPFSPPDIRYKLWFCGSQKITTGIFQHWLVKIS